MGEAKEPMDLFRQFFHTGDPFAAMHDKDPLHAEDLKDDAPPQSLGRKLSDEPRRPPRSRPPVKPHQMTPHEIEIPKPAVPFRASGSPGRWLLRTHRGSRRKYSCRVALRAHGQLGAASETKNSKHGSCVLSSQWIDAEKSRGLWLSIVGTTRVGA